MKIKVSGKIGVRTESLGNYIATFVKGMVGRVVVFSDFLVNCADAEFLAETALKKIGAAPTHYIG